MVLGGGTLTSFAEKGNPDGPPEGGFSVYLGHHPEAYGCLGGILQGVT